MKATDIPSKFALPFGASASPGFIRPIPTTSGDPAAASLTLGFPPNTATPVGAGGTPPNIQDFNGILNQATAWDRWGSAGGPVAYDATFQTAIGGYPQGGIVASVTMPGAFWRSLVDDNATNPDTGGAGWTRADVSPPKVEALNLRGNSTASSHTASWAADQIIAATSLAGVGFTGSDLLLAFNGAVVGAGGMDAGAMPTAADLSVYAIYNPTTNTWNTLGCLGTTSNGPVYSGANMPAGYVASCLLWVGVTSGGHFQDFAQVGRIVYVASHNVLSAGLATVPTAVSLAAIVPARTWAVSGNASTGATGSGVFLGGTPGTGTSGAGMIGFQWFSPSQLENYGMIGMLATQALIYYTADSTTFTLAVCAYQF